MQMASKELEVKDDVKVAEECKALMATEEELAENDTKVLLPLMEKFSRSYDQKAESLSDIDWLKGTLKEELPEKSDEEIQKDAEEIVNGIKEQDKCYASISEFCDNGGTKEKWVAKKISEACTGMEVAQFGEYLSNIDEVLAQNNREMVMAILNKSGAVSQNPNLHGFIAEQYHANAFNRNAVLQDSSLRAEVLRPEGQAYAKNSVDLLIKDMSQNGKVVERIQVKFGKDADATVRLLGKGDYRSQRALVPEGQRDAVAEKMPSKTVIDKIGGDDKTGDVASDPLSKKEALKMEERAQEKGRLPKKDTWNSYNTKELAYNIGRQAVYAGAGAAVLTAGIDTAAKLIQGKEIEPAETMKLAVCTGVDTGAKVSAAAAIKVGVEKGALKMLPKTIGNTGIVAVGCAAIENAKVLWKVANGEMTATQGADAMGRVTCSSFGSTFGAFKGGAAGAAVAAFATVTNPIGLAAAGIAGMIAGGMAGSVVGEKVYEGVKAVGKAAKTLAKKAIGSVVEDACYRLKEGGKAVDCLLDGDIGGALKHGWNAIKPRVPDILKFW